MNETKNKFTRVRKILYFPKSKRRIPEYNNALKLEGDFIRTSSNFDNERVDKFASSIIMSLSTFAFSMLGFWPRISKVNDCNGSLTTIFPCRPKADSAQVQLETPALNIFPPSIFCDVWATVYLRNLCLPLPEIMISLSSVTLSHDEPTIPLIFLCL